MIRDELRKINRDGLLPAGAVLVGGGARMPNIGDFGKEVLKIPVTVGLPKDIRGVSDKVNDPIYATCLGLMKYSFEEKNHIGMTKQFGEAVDKVKKIFKTFLP